MNQKIEDIRSIVKDIIERRMINTTPGVKSDFIKVVFSVRFFVSMNEDRVRAIWNGIRISEVMADFVIDSTREFLLRCFDENYTYATFCKEIALTFTHLAAPNSCIDGELLSSAPITAKRLEDLLVGNPWLVLLYICEGLIVMENENG